LFLKRNDDQRDEYVDEEERKHDEINYVEQRPLDVVIRYGSLVLFRGRYRILQHPIEWKHKNPRQSVLWDISIRQSIIT